MKKINVIENSPISYQVIFFNSKLGTEEFSKEYEEIFQESDGKQWFIFETKEAAMEFAWTMLKKEGFDYCRAVIEIVIFDNYIAKNFFYYEDLSIEEIANVLLVSSSCVKKRLERGRQMIKKEIENGTEFVRSRKEGKGWRSDSI